MPIGKSARFFKSPKKLLTMANSKTTRGRAQDRSKVAGGQEHEVKYEAEKTGESTSAVKDAVKKAGNSRKEVEKELSGSKGKNG